MTGTRLRRRAPKIAGGITPITQFSNTTSTSSTISWPGSLAAGMVAILIDYARSSNNSAAPTDVVPSGFTGFSNGTASAAGSLTTNGFRIRASYKLLTGSESGSITGMNGSSANDKRLLIYQGASPITSIVFASSVAAEATTGNPSSKSGTSTTPPSVMVGAAGTNTGTPAFSTESPAFGSTSSSSNVIVGRTISDSTTLAQTIDMSDLGNCNAIWLGFLEFA